MAARDGFEGGLEIAEGLDAVYPRGLDERCDAAPRLCRLPSARRTMRFFLFSAIGRMRFSTLLEVDLDASVMEEGLQAVPVTVRM